MKKVIITLALAIGLSQAYCEHGTQIKWEYSDNYQWKIGIYDFGQGRVLKFKFYREQSIPYSIRYDFYKDEMCYN